MSYGSERFFGSEKSWQAEYFETGPELARSDLHAEVEGRSFG